MSRIYQLEKTINQPGTQAPDAEVAPLLDNDDPDTVFRRNLDQELEKICSFYQLKELEIYGELGDLLKDGETYATEMDGMDMEQMDGVSDHYGRQRRGSLFSRFSLSGRKRRTSTMSASTIEEQGEDSDEDPNERTPMTNSGFLKDRRKTVDVSAGQGQGYEDLRGSRELPLTRRKTVQAADDFSENDQALNPLVASNVTLKKRTISLYVSLCELKSFIQLNKTGFSKVLKKYDKTLDRSLKKQYLKDSVEPAYPFRSATIGHIDENIQKIERTFADMATKGDMEAARRELRLHLREHVVWERNTVWREMIGVERKAQAANLGIRRTLLGGDHDPAKARLQGDDHHVGNTKEIETPVGRYRCPTWLFSSTLIWLLVILAVFLVMLLLPIMKKPEQQNCLAMLVFVSLLWATEVSIREMLSIPLTHARSYPFS